ncbi:DUF2283 domain-containing protein [Methanobrevibacter sp. DSM 116169]|uniref:DUF2283 domain-containing protein n=1 Tax=Methanobrevibacter sp. DSM 116169 TaxID=3242727 RepID=UPI0038FD1504
MKDKNYNIEYRYDVDTDALFINKVKNYNYDESIELESNIILDFDIDGMVCALEILNASKVFNVSNDYFNNIKNISIKIAVFEKLICLNLSVDVSMNNKKLLKSLDKSTTNDINAPVMETELATV